MHSLNADIAFQKMKSPNSIILCAHVDEMEISETPSEIANMIQTLLQG